MQEEQKMKNDITSTKYEVKDNGDVTMIQTVITTSTMSARNFRSFFVGQQKEIERINACLSEETKTAMLEERDLTEKMMQEMKPVLADAEEKAKADYEKQVFERKVNALKEELEKPKAKRNKTFLAGILDNLQTGEKEKIREELGKFETKDEKVNLVNAFNKLWDHWLANKKRK